MTSVAGLLSAVTKSIPFVTGTTSGDGDAAHKPLLAKADTEGQVGDSDESNGKLQRPTDSRGLKRKSDSHLGVFTPSKAERSLADPLQASCPSKPSASVGASVRAPRPGGHRSASNSLIETRLCSKRVNYPDTPKQSEILARLRRIKGADAAKRTKVQGEGATDASIADTDRLTRMEWRSSTRRNSYPSLRMSVKASNRPISKPLKTCLKQAKSADATPINETTPFPECAAEDQKLRRRKTVDFLETVPCSDVDIPNGATKHHKQRPIKIGRLPAQCPCSARLNKRSLASPALTRTAVHVVAVTASSPSQFVVGEACPATVEDPATPTMQILESSNGTHEIIWDDVPPEHDARTRRRSYSAGQALGALSTRSRGLERVNTKLTEWSGTWNKASDQFKPTFVVFPDDDGIRPCFECAVVGGEGVEISAPPNSERASASHSRHASRPASAAMSRAPSQDDPRATCFTRDAFPGDSSLPVEQAQVTPEGEVWRSYLARRKPRASSSDRRLSNIEEADIKFRDHRDSVTLAHSRLVNSGGVSPELIAHRDSVVLAKRRMYARNHSAATSQQLRRLKAKSEPGSLPDGDAAATFHLAPVVNADAGDALQEGTSRR